MNILTFDAAFGVSSAAIVSSERRLIYQASSVSPETGCALVGLVKLILDGHLTLDAIAVTIELGKFTASRATMAVAHGLASVLAIPIVGVTSFEVMQAAYFRYGQLSILTSSSLSKAIFDQTEWVDNLEVDKLPKLPERLIVVRSAATSLADGLPDYKSATFVSSLLPSNPNFVGTIGELRLIGLIPWREAFPIYGGSLKTYKQQGFRLSPI